VSIFQKRIYSDVKISLKNKFADLAIKI